MLLLGLGAAAAVAVPAGLALAQRPQRGVLVLAALVPFHGMLFLLPFPAGAAAWKEGLLLATVVAAGLRRVPRPGPVPAWTVPAGAMVALCLPWVLLRPDAVTAFGLKIYFLYALIPLALWWTPLSARDRDRLVSIVTAAAALAAAASLAQQAIGPEGMRALGYEYNTHIRFLGGHLRSIGTFEQPFPLALFLAFATVIGVPVALADLRRRRNQLVLAVTPLLLAGMLAAYVRVALVFVAVGFAYLAGHRFRILLHGTGPVVVAAVVLASAGVLSGIGTSSSLAERGDGWSGAGDRLLSAPFGQGPGTVGAAAERATGGPLYTGGSDMPAEAAAGYQPDNHYVKVALELGPLGLWAFAALLVTAFAAARRSALRARRPEDQALAAAVAASVLGASVAAVVSTYWEIFPMDVFFWLTLGVLSSIDNESSTTPWLSVPAAAGCRPTSGSSSGP